MQFEKIVFVDTETTGKYHNVHAIHQLSGEVWIRGSLAETFDLRFKPPTGAKLSGEAMRLNNLTVDELMLRPMSSKTAHDTFIEVLSKYVDKFDKTDKFTFVAYNAAFDWNFIQELSTRHGFKYLNSLIWFPPICVAQLAYQYLGDSRYKLPSFKLGSLLDYFGVAPDGDLHDALVDVRATRKLYFKMQEPPGEPGGSFEKA